MLEDPSILKIGQNAKYDLAVLSRYGIAVTPIEGHHADLLRPGCRKNTATGWTSFGPVARPPRSASSRWPVRARRRELPARGPRSRYLLRGRKTPTSPAASTTCCVLAWRKRACLRSTRPSSGRCRRCWRQWSATGCASIRPSFAISPTTSPCGWRSWRIEPRASPAGRSIWAAPKQIGDVLFGRNWAWPAARRRPPVCGAPMPGCSKELASTHELPRVLLELAPALQAQGTYTDALGQRRERAHRAGPYLLRPGLRRPPPIVIDGSQSAEHPDPHRRRAAGFAAPHRRTGPRAGERRLQPDRA